jgi:2-succinyl-6-hydroxy-2,4-cyclohexadiene-1-carboxylate synthase
MRWEWLSLWASQGSLPAEARERLRAQRLANRATGLANSLRGVGAGADTSVRDRLRTLDVPTLLVAGALDEKYVALGRAMEAALPHASLEIVADAGHAVHLERPAELVRLVLRFLDVVARADVRWK